MKRRLAQFISLLLLHSSWGPELKWLCSPVLSCHSCTLAWFACPIGVFVHYSGYHLFPYLALGTVLGIGLLLGRWLCGWVCPFGFLQDLLFRIPTRKFTLPAWTRNLKYAVLLLFVFLLPFVFGEQTVWSFCRVCPASALQVTLPTLLTGGGTPLHPLTVLKLTVLVAALVLTLSSERAFCRVLCPLGALLAPLNRAALLAVRSPTTACVACGACDRACAMGVKPSAAFATGREANRTPECVACGDCRRACAASERDGTAAAR